MTDHEPFLSRWSRRKVAAREPVEPAPDVLAPAVPQPIANAEPAQVEQAPQALPSIDSLRGLQSEYREFLQPDVDPGTQRAALKKLFSDPHFNQMDGLDVYIDDYNKFEPMSAAVAATLGANKFLHVVDHLLSEQRDKAAAESAPPQEAVVVSESPDKASDAMAAVEHIELTETNEVESPATYEENDQAPPAAT
ncbi:MAG: DUF3306 domain-containing protein [Betaproteobacteria bacterium]|nr:DUF3306 domain-containing protein [Betaproteobacteria bacterium]